MFCGWLCPFGALQELLAQISRALRLPQWAPSAQLESRLRYGKYAAAAVLLVLAFVAIGTAESAAEIEPFKTAITAKFSRTWPYVLYAGALLADRAIHRARLLPLPLSARRRAGGARPLSFA